MSKTIKAFFAIVSATPILFLVWMILSFFAFMIFPFPVTYSLVGQNIFMILGIIFMLGGTLLAFFAQRVSRVVSRPDFKATYKDLMQGPYKYTRHPGSMSLIIMAIGFACVVNSFIMLVLAGVLVLVLVFLFVPAEEKAITELCPEAYTEYKKHVRMWL